MRAINTREELIALARELGVRPDWHEPDEQSLTAELRGTPGNFDNAMGVEWYGHAHGEPRAELHVVLRLLGPTDDPDVAVDVAAVNLANLFAWATGHEQLTNAEKIHNQLAKMDPEGYWRRRLAEDIRDRRNAVTSAAEAQGLVGAAVAGMVAKIYDDLADLIRRGEL